jgi:sigma-B regulation protein RsbU (phosphoserine phosphatase)
MTDLALRAQIDELFLLQRVAQRMSSLLDIDLLLEDTVGDVSQTFGYSRSAVLLKDESTDELVIAAVRGWTVNYHKKGERFKIGQYGIVGHVGATGQTYYTPDVLLDPYYEVSEPLTRSELDIPLKGHGRLIGIFNVQSTSVDGFPPSRIRVLEALAGHLATAIENAELFMREQREQSRLRAELEEAQRIQRQLMPERDITHSAFTIAGTCLPCRTVAGDWYDYIILPNGRIAVVVADVAGKGMAAALLMSSTRGILRLLIERISDPAAILDSLNKILLRDFPPSRFVTMAYVLLDPSSMTARIGLAGHPPPVLIDGSARLLANCGGLPLGMLDTVYAEEQLYLAPGARLVLYSDGIIEAQRPDGVEYGCRGIERHFADPNASLRSLLDDLRQFVGGAPLEDDATAVTVEARKDSSA